MSIEETKTRKENLENQIAELIRNFQNETKIRVDDIQMIRYNRVLRDENHLDCVILKCSL